MEEDAPPPYDEAVTVLVTEKLANLALASCINDDDFNTEALFQRQVTREERQLCERDFSGDTRVKAEQIVEKRWKSRSYRRLSSVKELRPLLEKQLRWRVGKGVTAKFPSSGDDPNDYMMSRPVIQYKIFYWILAKLSQSKDCPAAYHGRSPQDIIKSEWGLTAESAAWLWPGEKVAEVSRKLSRFQFPPQEPQLPQQEPQFPQQELRRSARLRRRQERATAVARQSHGINSRGTDKDLANHGAARVNSKQATAHKQRRRQRKRL